MHNMRQVTQAQTPPKPIMSQGEQEVLAVRKALRHFTVQAEPECWLVPTYKEMAEVFGDPNRGIAYKKIYEVCGKYSGGKTALVQEIAGDAQTIDNADVGWVDLENSWDDRWARVRGLDPDRVAVFKPEVLQGGTFTVCCACGKKYKGKQCKCKHFMCSSCLKTGLHVSSAEEVFAEVEAWVKMKFAKNPHGKIFLGVDSTVAILSEQEEEGGLEGRARGTLAAFLSKMLRRWAPIVRTHNIMMFLVNQIRTNPGVAWGDPEYRPGGSALDHYTSVITKVKRARGKGQGWIFINAQRAGIKTVIQNQKNKVGGQEGIEVGAKIYWKKRSKFVPVEEIESKSQS